MIETTFLDKAVLMLHSLDHYVPPLTKIFLIIVSFKLLPDGLEGLMVVCFPTLLLR